MDEQQVILKMTRSVPCVDEQQVILKMTRSVPCVDEQQVILCVDEQQVILCVDEQQGVLRIKPVLNWANICSRTYLGVFCEYSWFLIERTFASRM